ncbi:MAG: Phenolic acid decarboxylase PadC [Syntrophorhabdus sp. PtaU1.Bin153]|nr:MAG: Phenolic acid decarboxylase PadC [Syntrophorhabdus sp. PtaU1.Bin153]
MPHGLVGKRIKYRYANGWEYQVYYESEQKVSYEVISGPFAGRRAYQVTCSREVAPNIFMVGWYEETGTVVVQTVNLNAMEVTGFVAFPRWVFDNPALTHGNKDDDLPRLMHMRETMPDAPREIVFEVARIFSVETSIGGEHEKV